MMVTGPGELFADDAGQRREVRLRADVGVDRHPGPVQHLATLGDEAGLELRAADVDGTDHTTRFVPGVDRGTRHGRERYRCTVSPPAVNTVGVPPVWTNTTSSPGPHSPAVARLNTAERPLPEYTRSSTHPP